MNEELKAAFLRGYHSPTEQCPWFHGPLKIAHWTGQRHGRRGNKPYCFSLTWEDKTYLIDLATATELGGSSNPAGVGSNPTSETIGPYLVYRGGMPPSRTDGDRRPKPVDAGSNPAGGTKHGVWNGDESFHYGRDF